MLRSPQIFGGGGGGGGYDGITHCNENSSLADFIATIKLDDGLSCDRYSLLEVLVGVGAFNEPTLFDKDSLDLVSFGELKKSLTGG